MIAFILASSGHGAMIVNRFDYHGSAEHGFGVGYEILKNGTYDPRMVEHVGELLTMRRKYFGDGVVAIDCGANIGAYTVEWARLMAGWGSVIAIEAQERIYYGLAGNIALNNCFNARAILAAVSDSAGVMKCPAMDYCRPTSFGSLEIRPRAHPEPIGQTPDYVNGIEVPCLTLDSLNLQRVDLVKIDVEGMELEVLAGAADLLKRCKPILVVEHIKVDKNKLGKMLEGMGYAVFEFGINFIAVNETDETRNHVDQGSDHA